MINVCRVGITYLLKVNNKNNETKCEICLKLTPCSCVSIVNFKHVIGGWLKDISYD